MSTYHYANSPDPSTVMPADARAADRQDVSALPSGYTTLRQCCMICAHAVVDGPNDLMRLCELTRRHVSARYWCDRWQCIASDAAGQSEADLLAACLEHLRACCYYCATPENHTAIGSGRITVRGTYAHLHGDVRGQPQLPDLLILARDRAGVMRALCVELKAVGKRGGEPRYQTGQREMIDGGYWVECRTLDGFRSALAEWEKGGVA